MTNEEAKQALISGQMVEYNGHEYALTAIVYKCINGKILVSAELLPLNGANSLTVASIKNINRRIEK